MKYKFKTNVTLVDYLVNFTIPGVKLLIISLYILVNGLVFACFIELPFHQFAIHTAGIVSIITGICLMIPAVLRLFKRPECVKIKQYLEKVLYHLQYGNPLQLHEGELCPPIIVTYDNKLKRYCIRIKTTPVSAEKLSSLKNQISSSINDRYSHLAVVKVNTDIAQSYVEFYVENCRIDRSYTYTDVAQMRPKDNITISIQKGIALDLRYSNSILCCGRTRSGKTTAIVEILLHVLSMGRDEFGSEIIIIDPKQAELSQLPHVVTLDSDGEARTILAALNKYIQTITFRQKILNELSKESGDAVHWWETGFKPSYIVLDEFLMLRSIFPNKPAKGSDYCLASFDAAVKRILTTGASSGSFMILCSAEASVLEAGVSSIIKHAVSTRILFKPSLPEARLIWDNGQLEDLPERIYQPGDCLISSQDGVLDEPQPCHFPHLHFPVYRELGRLLENYYTDKSDDGSNKLQDGAVNHSK